MKRRQGGGGGGLPEQQVRLVCRWPVRGLKCPESARSRRTKWVVQGPFGNKPR